MIFKENVKNIKDFKEYLKEQAESIRQLRIQTVECGHNGQLTKANNIHCKKISQARQYRHYHIAYCELRGTPRDKIERPASDNLPNEQLISAIKEFVIKEMENEQCNT